jgi:hypothetical protein
MEELKKVIDKIEQVNSELLKSKKALNKNTQDIDAHTEVQHYEAQLSDLKADKERWFKLVEEEKKKGNLNYSYSNIRCGYYSNT